MIKFIVAETKSPPQVVAEATRIGFPIRPVRRPHDGFFMSNWTRSAMPIEIYEFRRNIKLLILC